MSLSRSASPMSSPNRLVLVTLGTVALTTAYVLYLKRSISQHVASSHGTRVPATKSTKTGGPDDFPKGTQVPSVVPPEVASQNSDQILSFERIVSNPISASKVAFPLSGLDSSPSSLLTAYIRTTMTAFSWTPQAFMLRAMVPKEAKQTFGAEAIAAMDFASPHWVTGVYRVAHRGMNPQGTGDQVILNLEPPEGYHGPVVKGLIVAGVEKVDSGSGEPQVVFVNETWMWRAPSERPTLLEGSLSRWMHTWIISSMVVKGIHGVSIP